MFIKVYFIFKLQLSGVKYVYTFCVCGCARACERVHLCVTENPYNVSLSGATIHPGHEQGFKIQPCMESQLHSAEGEGTGVKSLMGTEVFFYHLDFLVQIGMALPSSGKLLGIGGSPDLTAVESKEDAGEDRNVRQPAQCLKDVACSIYRPISRRPGQRHQHSPHSDVLVWVPSLLRPHPHHDFGQSPKGFSLLDPW